MNRYILPATLLILALSPTGAGAHEVAPAEGTADFELAHQELGAFVSTPTETRDQFMARVGVFLAQYTKATGWEACGMLQQAQDGSGWGINLTTNGSQVACVQTHYELPGYTPTGEGIHSHPASHSVRLSRQDARLGRGMCGSHLGVSPFSFSGPDYAAGPGWLVTPAEPLRSAKLLYQSGKGTETTVTTLDLSVAVRPDRGPLPGWQVVQTGVSLVASPMVREDVKWGRRTCKAF